MKLLPIILTTFVYFNKAERILQEDTTNIDLESDPATSDKEVEPVVQFTLDDEQDIYTQIQ